MKVIQIWGHLSKDTPGLHVKYPRLNLCVYNTPRLCFEPLKLPKFDLNADLDAAFHSNANVDPDSKNNADSHNPIPNKLYFANVNLL